MDPCIDPSLLSLLGWRVGVEGRWNQHPKSCNACAELEEIMSYGEVLEMIKEARGA